jgi:hypothetical protein
VIVAPAFAVAGAEAISNSKPKSFTADFADDAGKYGTWGSVIGIGIERRCLPRRAQRTQRFRAISNSKPKSFTADSLMTLISTLLGARSLVLALKEDLYRGGRIERRGAGQLAIQNRKALPLISLMTLISALLGARSLVLALKEDVYRGGRRERRGSGELSNSKLKSFGARSLVLALKEDVYRRGRRERRGFREICQRS